MPARRGAPKPAPARAKAPASARGPRRARLSPSTEVVLDGDLVFLIDALYREFAVSRGFSPDYQDVQRAIDAVRKAMTPREAAEYFSASLFLNYVTYENEMADRLAESIRRKARKRG